MKKWYVVQVRYKQEQLAIDNLKAQGFVTYNPMVVEIKERKRENKELLVPLFSGYMFVQLDCSKDKWRAVCSTKGVYKLLTASDDGCTPLPKGFIAALQKREDIHGHLPLNKMEALLKKYVVGEELKIINGTFKGFRGICTGINQNKITILFTLLNQKTSISLSRNYFARASC